MIKEIVYTDKYALILSDEQIKDVRPHKDKFHLEKGSFINQFPTYLTDLTQCKLIIAHLPLTDAPILEGVPLLPPLSQGDNVEELAESTFGTDIDSIRGSQEYDLNKDLKTGFVRGYNKAKEKYKYTEEDMINFAIWYYKTQGLSESNIKYWGKDLFQVWKSLQQPSRPTHFECETTPMDLDEIRKQGKGFLNANIYKIKTTTNSQGQIEFVGKYSNQ